MNKSPSEYMVKLSNGETYCFYPSKTSSPNNLDTSTLRFKVRTVESVQDEAYRNHKKEIPANTELEVLDVLTNFYGRWLEVIYKGLHYYIDPSKVEYVGSIEQLN